MADENSNGKLAVIEYRKLKSTILIICLSFSIVPGCAVIQGKLINTYESEYHDTVQASRDTLINLKIPVTEKMSDELKTVIKAKRFDGTTISIEVIRIEDNLTEVSITTGSVGVFDRRVSGQIHNYIKKELVKYSHKEKNLIETKPEKNYQTPSMGSSDQYVSKKIPETQRPTNRATTKSTKDSSIQNKTKHQLYDAESEADLEFKIFFQKNSNELSEKAVEKLDRIFEIMTNNPDYELTIIGFPDSESPPPYNKMISDLRVAGVKMYLIGKGLNLSEAKTIFFETEGNPPNHSVELKINAQTGE